MRVTRTLAILIGVGLQAPSLAWAAAAREPLRIVGLRTEYKQNPLGIDARKPRLSWQIQAAGRGITQSAYQVRVARSERGVQGGSDLVWDSGRVTSDESIQRGYDGPPLRSGQRYYWQVRIWDGSGKTYAWSTPALWGMGPLEDAVPKARLNAAEPPEE